MNKTSPASAPSLGVFIVRVLLLLGAAAALVVGVALAQTRTLGSSGERYVCPMHPEVVSAVPGDCPICNMALERAGGAKQAEGIVPALRSVEEVKRRVIAQVVRAPAWVDRGGMVTAVIHEEALQEFKPGDAAVFFDNIDPAVAVPVRLSSDPTTPWDAATVRARFAADKALGSEGDTGWLQLDAKPQQLLVVPESAVLYASDGAYVLAAPAGGHAFKRRSLELGRILDSGHVAERDAERLGGIVVLSGLSEGDQVVTADTFVLDAERRLRAAQGRVEDVIE
jgi:hypothetical protein